MLYISKLKHSAQRLVIPQVFPEKTRGGTGSFFQTDHNFSLKCQKYETLDMRK